MQTIMPQHRRSEVLPKRLIDRVKASESSPFFGHVLTVAGGGLRGLRHNVRKKRTCAQDREAILASSVFGLQLSGGRKAPVSHPIDVQYSLMDHILTRVEFLRGEPAIPLHIAHFDPVTGKRFSVILDCY